MCANRRETKEIWAVVDNNEHKNNCDIIKIYEHSCIMVNNHDIVCFYYTIAVDDEDPRTIELKIVIVANIENMLVGR